MISGSSKFFNLIELSVWCIGIFLEVVVNRLGSPGNVLSEMDLPSHQEDLVPAHRIFILVTGTEPSALEPLHPDVTDMQKQSYLVKSYNAKCLLSEKKTAMIDLKCYCNFDTMLNFRLDKETALVSLTAVTMKDGRMEAAVDAMEKISLHDLDSIRTCFIAEWKTALTNDGISTLEEFESPAKTEYWNGRKRQVAGLDSDPKTPLR